MFLLCTGDVLLGKSKYLWSFQQFLCFCNKKTSIDFKSTLLLPRTKFPHKVTLLNRRERDRFIEKEARFVELYALQRNRSTSEEFILHDGPPYANGDVHVGHAVNKILKDITVRYQALRGKRIKLIPGWDCHGLPIELQVLKQDIETDPLQIRKKAFTFSQKTKAKQKKSFREWGIMADWERSYFTCDPEYIVRQLNVFQDLYDKGIIFRDHKPVFWSPQNRTSLAEAELEYDQNHLSSAIYVKFPIIKLPQFLRTYLKPEDEASVLIWTTTPWSIPANQAVGYSPEINYSFIKAKYGTYYLVAEEMVPKLRKVLKKDDPKCIKTFKGDILQSFTYQHPFIKGRECPLIPADHVTLEKGTGLVHMAPNHGMEDYVFAKKHRLNIDPCIVDENGCYNEYAGPDLVGKCVLTTGMKHVCKVIDDDILWIEDYTHSYPCDWRSKTPVIIRSCHQWFIDVDKIRTDAIRCLEDVQIIPDHFRKVFVSQIESSPQWCISRQRAWGVPIPAFYSQNSNQPLVHRDLTNQLCSLIKKNGIHAWWEANTEDILTPDIKQKLNLNSNQFRKESDIMDIWFDSGTSWNCVLDDPHISDLCLEGVDQIRGWFNSSLLTSAALRGRAPYKKLFLHGFTTDAEGRKMSKSEGNVISPSDILNGSKEMNLAGYGVDVLRWWVAAHACQSTNTPIKPKVFNECYDNINKFRNVFKFLLGSLCEFDPDLHLTDASELRPLDLFMLHELKHFMSGIMEQYSLMAYKNVSKSIINFISNDVSSFYCSLVKDRLYCEHQISKERLGCQTVLYYILNALIQAIGPICPHLSSEALLHHPSSDIAKSNVITHPWPSLDTYLKDTASPSSILMCIQIRDAILKTGVKTVNMHASVLCSETIEQAIQDLCLGTEGNSALLEFFQVSNISFNDPPTETNPGSVTLTGHVEGVEAVDESLFSITLMETKLHKCPRCWQFISNSETSLCDRCELVVNNSVAKESVVCK